MSLMWRYTAVGMLLLPAAGCGRETVSPRPAQGVLHVFVSIPPQKYFVERVGGPHVKVSVLLTPGQSPHTYEPTARQMVELSKADVFFCIGVPFEKQLVAKVRETMPQLKVVDTSAGIALLRAKESCADDEHDDHEHHDHDQLDRHIWMNPRLVKVQARTVCAELARLDPARRADYEANGKAFEADLDRLDAQISAALAPFRGKAFFVYHPALGYFADAYGLEQVAVETGGKQPSARQLTALIDRARQAGVKLIFVQPQFARQSAVAVAEAIGGAVVPLDPLAEDYLANLLDVAEKIRTALTASAPRPGH